MSENDLKESRIHVSHEAAPYLGEAGEELLRAKIDEYLTECPICAEHQPSFRDLRISFEPNETVISCVPCCARSEQALRFALKELEVSFVDTRVSPLPLDGDASVPARGGTELTERQTAELFAPMIQVRDAEGVVRTATVEEVMDLFRERNHLPSWVVKRSEHEYVSEKNGWVRSQREAAKFDRPSARVVAQRLRKSGVKNVTVACIKERERPKPKFDAMRLHPDVQASIGQDGEMRIDGPGGVAAKPAGSPRA